MGKRAFNLLEVTIASFLFATMVVLFAGLWSGYYSMLGRSRYQMIANHLGDLTMQEVQAAGYDGAQKLVGERIQTVRQTIRNKEILVDYHCTVSVREVPVSGVRAQDNEMQAMYKVDVLVSWDEPQIRARSLKFETLLCKN